MNEPKDTEQQQEPVREPGDDTAVESRTKDETSTLTVQDDAGSTTVTREHSVDGQTYSV